MTDQALIHRSTSETSFEEKDRKLRSRQWTGTEVPTHVKDLANKALQRLNGLGATRGPRLGSLEVSDRRVLKSQESVERGSTIVKA